MAPYSFLLLLALDALRLSHALPTHASREVGLAARAVDDCPGYKASNIVTTDSSLTADLSLAGNACNVYGSDIADLKLLVEYQTDERLHVMIYDSDTQVYQVHEEVLSRPQNEGGTASSAALQFSIVETPFHFTVIRKENNETLFDTSAAQLIFESQYVRLRTKLPEDPNLYGLGEHSDDFRLATENYTRTLWNAESPNIPLSSNLYGSHPVYFDHRGNKGTHGVFLANANGMDVKINKTAETGQYLEYNINGGVLDFYFLAGKKPAEVSRQYAQVVGFPAMAAYWTFGFHQCKYGYWDVNMVAEVVGNYSTAGIPLEAMWTDIDYMELRKDFTTDPDRFPRDKMRSLIDTLHKRDQRYVLILDPAIKKLDNYPTYERGKALDVFLKLEDGSEYLGVQWPGISVWPDWLYPPTQQWWTDEFSRFFNPETGLDIDAIWVDMNEASNFCGAPGCNITELGRINPPLPSHSPRPNTGRPIQGFPSEFQPSTSYSHKKTRQAGGDKKGLPSREWFNPGYKINNQHGTLERLTLWTNTTNHDGTRQYDTHNLYGATMAAMTRSAMLTRRPTKRPMVLTRSTWSGTGKVAAHWFGDNNSSWLHYRVSIQQMLAFVGMHQMPMVGSDVCGFNGIASEHMCARWALLGAFQPFYRNHADTTAPFQEFYLWESVTAAAKKAIDVRYRLMDYIYTALYYQTTTGNPMINPLWFLYPEDSNTFGIQWQYFYGDALLISPVVDDDATSVSFYLPKDIYYDFWTRLAVEAKGETVSRENVGYDDIPVHIRGGTIIPLRIESANTTTALRTKDFEILVAPGSDGTAKGRLYLDDGESLVPDRSTEVEFEWDGSKLSANGRFEYVPAQGESINVARVVVLQPVGERVGGSLNAGTRSVEVLGPWKFDGEFEVKLDGSGYVVSPTHT